ncbi:MazG nucleotide pyrophosphohydrolase domain-containing protein [Planctomycetes bacterium Pan216]
MYGRKDQARGAEGTFLWLMEEIGELAAEVRGDNHAALQAEFADVLAWLATLANVMDVDLNQALLDKYGVGCPGCLKSPCACSDSEKP